MKKHYKHLLLSLVVTLLMAVPSQASLVRKSVGLHPVHRFPLWYQDVLGAAAIRLQVCLDPAFCNFSPVVPLNPWSVRTGFGAEAFYWQGRASIPNRGGANRAGVRADIDMVHSATYEKGIANRNRKVENFITITVRGLPNPGPYTVTWPYGQRVVRAVNGEINLLIGPVVNQPLDFTTAMSGPVGPYLKAVNPPPPAGFLGNPNTLQTVTGSPRNTNFFRVVAPTGTDIGGSTLRPNVIITTLFKIQGRRF